MKSFISFLLACVVLLSPFTSNVSAQEKAMGEEQQSTESAKMVEYDLAYPGILPDHPLYILKKIRDKFIPLLIQNSKRKIEYYLLQADKGILASAMLAEQEKYDLAQDTALKAEHNYTLITYNLQALRDKSDTSTFEKLEQAALKHQEVLSSIIGRVPEADKSTFETVLEFSKRNLERIKQHESEEFQSLLDNDMVKEATDAASNKEE